MEKVIWIIGSDRREMLEAQQRVNAVGSMRARCLLSTAALEHAIQNRREEKDGRIGAPSLIVVDYEMAVKEQFLPLTMLKNQPFLAGVPVFFMVKEKTHEIDEECFAMGAMVVLRKPFSESSILRMERMAWQHEVTKNYEKMLQKQAGDLQTAREIAKLNTQLETRNELLYQVFGRYFSDEVLQMILEHPEEAAIGGVRSELTVMMSDLRGFTAFSENLHAQDLTDFLNYYFGKMVDVIDAYHGTVIEFLGDGILAVFGALRPVKEQAAHAVAAAIKMQQAMNEVNAYAKKKGFRQLEMGIGVHCGEAFVGNVGSEKMMRYNVIGQVVNECSRIESCSVGGQVFVSGEVLERISCPVDICNPVEVMVKGVQKPIRVCQVLGIRGEYSCYLEQEQELPMQSLKKTATILVSRIEGKQVVGEPMPAVLRQLSEKSAVLTLSGNGLELFSDVVISEAVGVGRCCFFGVYAKVVAKEGGQITLHFTHTTTEFRDYVKEVLADGEE